MYYDIMSSQKTKLVLVPLEERKRLNKNGGGDTYTTIEIPLSKPRNQEGRGKKEEQQDPPPPPISHCPALQDNEELGQLPPPPLPPSSSSKGRRGKKGRGKGGGRNGGEGELKLSEMLVIDLQEKDL